MPTLIFDKSELLANWAAMKIPFLRGVGFGPCQAIGMASGPGDDAELYGAVVFHDYQANFGTIQVSNASTSPKWLTPGTVRAVFHYPFQQLGVFKMWGAIPHTHTRALKLNRGLGLKVDGTLRHHYGQGTHAVIVSMTKPEYMKSRWYVQVPRDPGRREAA